MHMWPSPAASQPSLPIPTAGPFPSYSPRRRNISFILQDVSLIPPELVEICTGPFHICLVGMETAHLFRCYVI